MKNVVHIGAGGEIPRGNETMYHLFEPRDDDKLDSNKDRSNVVIYPFAASDYNGVGILNITNKLGCSSFLEPNLELLQTLQPDSWNRFQISKSVEVPVKRADSVLDNSMVIDTLVIDTQGYELNVLKGCGDLLKNTRSIICEVEYVELYKNQPLFDDIKSYLESLDFEFVDLDRVVYWDSETPIFADAIFENKNLK